MALNKTKRDKNSPKEIARKAKTSATILRKIKEDPEFRKNWHNKTVKAGKTTNKKYPKQSNSTIAKRLETFNKMKRENPDIFRNAGSRSHKYENEVAKTIIAEKIYQPFEICDRIIVKNGKILFIEIKHPNERLRPKQIEFQLIAKDQYQVLYGN